MYHADGGLVGEARYVIGHLLGRTHCSLCDITHSPVRRKRQWDELVATLGAPVRTYHLNEMPADVAGVVAEAGSPIFLQRNEEGLRVLLTPMELESMAGSVPEFAEQLRRALRDRDEQGRARNARPRDALGRPLPRGSIGVEPLPEKIDTDPAAVVALTNQLLDNGLPFQAHEALEAAWKQAPPPQRAAWQGLAQLAVALTHAQRGNDVGARRLRTRAKVNLETSELPEVAVPLQRRLLAETDASIRTANTPR